ncbi:Smg-4/UPF3 family-domain-containing protein [Rhodocollybia butyracea]|uniref:Smg-4/UPF3 family-domain-containing protein n=1 Tax=Rhodocollybia butyracea TaxID=206335 RepID=A0A9P5UFK2_9AGAR|nr:Smg-4/UPF3 family-domain-containing protein [Rhodocollybia butyracea]
MASTTVNPTSPTQPPKSKKEKEREKKERDRERKEKAAQHSERLKIVVRKLPPNLPEEIFWQSVQTWVTDETTTWKIYYPGKFRSRVNKENIASRAYIVFKDEEQLALFSREYDGHLFRDKSGNESQAVVEFAPYQKVPPEKKKPDARNGTIEKDENYISFIESLAAAANPEPISIEALIALTQAAPQPKTTPLLEALKAEKSAVKDKPTMKEKVAIMRNTTHETARKEDATKKKGGKATNSHDTPAAPSASNKKSHSSKKPVNPGAGPAPAASGPSKSGGSPAKLSKAARQQASSQTQLQPPIKVLTNASAATTVAPPTTSVSSDPRPEPPSSTAPRRGRPILGLASRHFEAALSGAGVGAGERKSRRERDKERESGGVLPKEKEMGSGGGKDPSSTANTTPTNSRPSPSSPKRDRGNAKRKGSISGASGAPSAVASKVPNILRRTVAPDGPSDPGSNASSTMLQRGGGGGDESVLGPMANEGGSSARGGRRGRGRGGRGSGNADAVPRPG